MSSFSSIDISASGLFAQRTRLDTIANNIANANTTRTDQGGPYRRQEVIFGANSGGGVGREKPGVQIFAVVESPNPPKMVHDPSHPDSDEQGMVAMPNINIIEEMVDMITATRAYEANIQAINAAKSMAAKALEIGRG